MAALATLALGTLISGGLTAPQPRRAGADFDLRVVFGDHGIFGRQDRDRRERDRSLRERRDRVARDERAVEVVPCSLDLTAYQVGDMVMLVARGENRSGGYTTRLEQASHGSTAVCLRNLAPVGGGYAAPCLTPFEITGSFAVRGRVDEITVNIAGTTRCVRVCRVNTIRCD